MNSFIDIFILTVTALLLVNSQHNDFKFDAKTDEKVNEDLQVGVSSSHKLDNNVQHGSFFL